jgi:hypothetical protein
MTQPGDLRPPQLERWRRIQFTLDRIEQLTKRMKAEKPICTASGNKNRRRMSGADIHGSEIRSRSIRVRTQQLTVLFLHPLVALAGAFF